MRLTSLTVVPFLLLLWCSPAVGDLGSSLHPPGLHQLISKGDNYLSQRQFGDAVRTYSDALQLNPTDYLVYYKRASAYLSLSRHASALEDLAQVLALTSNSFDRAHLLTARIHTLAGHWSAASKSLSAFSSSLKANKKSGKYRLSGEDREREEEAEAEKLKAGIEAGQRAEKQAKNAAKSELWQLCVEESSTALSVATQASDIRRLRIGCELEGGDIVGAVGDLNRLAQVETPVPSLTLDLFRLAYFLLPADEGTPAALGALKQCLHYDPDSKPCFRTHKKVKDLQKRYEQMKKFKDSKMWHSVLQVLFGKPKADGSGETEGGGLLTDFEDSIKEYFLGSSSSSSVVNILPHPASPATSSSSKSGDWFSSGKEDKEKEVGKAKATLNRLPKELEDKLWTGKVPRLVEMYEAACQAMGEVRKARLGEQYCDKVLAMEGREGDPTALMWKAEVHMINEEWEQATRLLERAFENSQKQNREVHERLEKARKFMKQSKHKDYYKVLGVARDASDTEIKKAYKKAAKKSHPDKGGTEQAMAAVNEAYEVLSNPQLRAKFDGGEDPMDPTGGQGYGNPFGGAGGSNFVFQQPFMQFFTGGFTGSGGRGQQWQYAGQGAGGGGGGGQRRRGW